MKPDFAAQNVIEVNNEQERKNWFQLTSKEFHNKGATWLRASYDPNNPDIILMEGWNERPFEEPDPFFFYTNKES